ncbi:hypothetical protein B9Z19DRAFT_1123175 [Tuber borchii]|uniref:Uncharacterized protein n=1 Tax=Tuber borchii TaxID=42251 RepID=A0A2T6ZZ51_TUBBO|nr:hypothetical protein B9Z19DRAFT_1123175 [Tuber borchii]
MPLKSPSSSSLILCYSVYLIHDRQASNLLPETTVESSPRPIPETPPPLPTLRTPCLVRRVTHPMELSSRLAEERWVPAIEDSAAGVASSIITRLAVIWPQRV